MAILTGTFDDDEVGGTLQSDLILALAGDDVVVGSGGADTIDGGTGNDTLYANTRSNTDDGDMDTLNGGAGNDVIYGAVGDNLNGGTGRDTLYLDLSGADRGISADFRELTLGVDLGLGELVQIDLPLLGGTLGSFEIVKEVRGSQFSDEIFIENVAKIGATVDAEGGNDTINTRTGDDVLSGGTGDDRLNASGGRDHLDGGAGDDMLIGGGGLDVLTGDRGADVFRFGDGDTGRGRNTADRITDFSQAEGDRIMLTPIDAHARTDDNDRFSFIGDEKFSGTAGELRFTHFDGNTFVQGDVDGNGEVDFTIRLDGMIDLTAADFNL